jgi:hypothetical protein
MPALTAPGSRIEGIGRPRVEPSFVRTLVDRMVDVADVDSVAAMRVLSQLLGRRVGPSTGTNFVAMLTLAHEMRERGESGSILSLLCDAGERYLPTYYNCDWVQRRRWATARRRRAAPERAAGLTAMAPCALGPAPPTAGGHGRFAGGSGWPGHWPVAGAPRRVGLALPAKTLQFPRDHGSHPDLRTEWWYITGHAFADGRPGGFR